MSEHTRKGRPVAVPSARISRLAGFGKLATGIASRAVVEGARRVGRGEIPNAADLFLTPTNVLKVSQELSRMRGAALKLGQLLSMDTGEFLPRELAELLSPLRSEADFMPETQLRSVLNKEWGDNWQYKFEQFDDLPMAAASIGQVHRAKTKDGRELAVKVQYPGIADSIDSDLNNALALFSMSGFAPPKDRLEPMIAEAKQQLHEEADYRLEAANIDRFNTCLGPQTEFALPQVQHDLSTDKVLAMSFVPGLPIESVEHDDPETRNRVVKQLCELALLEVFRFQLVQTDPNFANYTYDAKLGKIGLLDFGAVREVSLEEVHRFKQFFAAGLAGDRARLRELAVEIGFYNSETPLVYRNTIDRMIVYGFGALRRDAIFDFSDDQLLEQLRSLGLELALDRDFNEIPPINVIFLQRKAVGLFLLARRLKACVPLRAMIEDICK